VVGPSGSVTSWAVSVGLTGMGVGTRVGARDPYGVNRTSLRDMDPGS
jgi:hypothetical protein